MRTHQLWEDTYVSKLYPIMVTFWPGSRGIISSAGLSKTWNFLSWTLAHRVFGHMKLSSRIDMTSQRASSRYFTDGALKYGYMLIDECILILPVSLLASSLFVCDIQKRSE